MGSWGVGVFENDHALDLLSIERAAWQRKFEECMEIPAVAWDDIEGPLIYVHLLATVAPGGVQLTNAARYPGLSSREIAGQWHAAYVAALSSHSSASEGYLAGRRAVVDAVFEALVSAASDSDAPKAPRRARKSPTGRR
ncbi:MAG: hypothetical protein KIT72_06270 [Polyangiaceae bacterium]|nr:hypothetical protein [Polyangiaceae bacterium]MCW5790006.1 hypothetical protein [Polyangiaceae bacterium]